MTDRTDAFEQLRALAYAGAERRYGTVAPVTRDRLEHELAIIGMKGFADYFLVVHDIIAHGPTHCGRGSVANSVVSYCLGITHVEPLGAGLLFERFLNPARTDPPDIDLDFPWDERDRVLAYVFRRYPFPRAAMVANHNCFRLRGALRHHLGPVEVGEPLADGRFDLAPAAGGREKEPGDACPGSGHACSAPSTERPRPCASSTSATRLCPSLP
jgi:DNA polymerase III alpha subunit